MNAVEHVLEKVEIKAYDKYKHKTFEPGTFKPYISSDEMQNALFYKKFSSLGVYESYQLMRTDDLPKKNNSEDRKQYLESLKSYMGLGGNSCSSRLKQ